MLDRVQVDPDAGFGTPSLRPAAQAQDTYVRPLRGNDDTEASQLATALSGLSPALAQLGDAFGDQQRDTDIQAGTEQAQQTVSDLDASRTTFADAVRNGQIPANMNPWMKQGYYEELGRTYAGKFQSDLSVALGQNEPLKSSVEMSDYNQFVSKFESQWLDTNIPANVQNGAFQTGFGARSDAIKASMSAGWAAQTEQRFKANTLSMFRDEAVNYVQSALDNKQDPTLIGQNLKQMLDDKHALGWGATDTGNTMIDALSDVALDRKDPTLMKSLLGAIPSGPGQPSSSYAIQVEAGLGTKIFQLRDQQREAQAWQRSDTSDAIYTTASQRFMQAAANGTPKGPGAVDVTDLQTQALNNGDPALAARLDTMQKAYLSPEYQDNPDTKASLSVDLYHMRLSQSQLDTALSNKQLSMATFTQMSTQLHEYQHQALDEGRQGPLPDPLARDPYYKEGVASLGLRFQGGAESTTSDAMSLSLRHQQASDAFEQWYYNNYTAPNAPGASQTTQARRLAVQQETGALATAALPKSIMNDGTGSMDLSDLNWRTAPIGSRQQVQQMITDLSSGRPLNTYEKSVAKIYNFNYTDPAARAEFLKAQQAQLTSLSTPQGATRGSGVQ